MTLPLASAQPRTTLHLYRHLLREATYLPPVCRQRIEPRIKLRFRNHRGDPDPSYRVRRANHDLRYLRAANGGDLARMRRLMLMAFGRIGWRRQELMTELERAEQPSSAAELEAQIENRTELDQAKAEGALKQDWLDEWNTGKMLAFAKSQSLHKTHNSPRPQVTSRRLNPAQAVPSENSWGRSFTPSVARTKLQKWWRGFEHRILPPLPRGEWELLKQLATGQASAAAWQRVPARRPPAVPLLAPEEQELVWDWEKYATTPIRAADRGMSRRFRVSSGAEQYAPKSPYDGPAIGIHNYTPRLWRRLYAEIWQMSAMMEPAKKEGKKGGSGWTITWGGIKHETPRATARSYEFFEGVDSKGQVPGQAVDTKAPRAKPKRSEGI